MMTNYFHVSHLLPCKVLPYTFQIFLKLWYHLPRNVLNILTLSFLLIFLKGCVLMLIMQIAKIIYFPHLPMCNISTYPISSYIQKVNILYSEPWMTCLWTLDATCATKLFGCVLPCCVEEGHVTWYNNLIRIIDRHLICQYVQKKY